MYFGKNTCVYMCVYDTSTMHVCDVVFLFTLMQTYMFFGKNTSVYMCVM
jgi:hypothetical protein